MQDLHWYLDEFSGVSRHSFLLLTVQYPAPAWFGGLTGLYVKNHWAKVFAYGEHECLPNQKQLAF